MTGRVVVTGIGCITPLGKTADEFWDHLIKGSSTLSETRRFGKIEYLKDKISGEVDYIDLSFLKKIKKTGMASCYLLYAARKALEDACLLDNKNISVVFGTAGGNLDTLVNVMDDWYSSKYNVKPHDIELNKYYSSDISDYNINTMSFDLLREFDLNGESYGFVNACAASNHALAYGFDLIKNREATIILAGGVDILNLISFIGFDRFGIIAREKCRPFDKFRNGLIHSEGAGVLILEELNNAKKRRAKIYGEFIGYGLSCDISNLVSNDIEGASIHKSIVEAVNSSKITLDDIDYICAHGTGTVVNDASECIALKRVFGDRLADIPVSSIKGTLGHTLGASGILGAITSLYAINNDAIPPTINFSAKDDACNIDCVPNIKREKKIRCVLNNSFGLGGSNSVTVFRKFEE